MSIKIVKGDITKMDVDAIVNVANRYLIGRAGVNGAIHRATGPQLYKECSELGRCKVGEAKITAAYNMPARYIIHTVGPTWQGGNNDEERLLASCCHNSLQIALEKGVQTIAFPLISSSVYGYPKDKALMVAMHEFERFLEENETDIKIVIYDNDKYKNLKIY